MKTPLWEQNTSKKVYKAENAREFLQIYDQCSHWADVLMAQAWVEGPDANLYSCNCYFDAKSQPLVTFVARKLRQWPVETGTSCLGEEVRNDAVLEATLELSEGLTAGRGHRAPVSRGSAPGRPDRPPQSLLA